MIRGVLGHYEIVERLGEGGMGAVYRALDTRLRRHVALKVLPDELASSRQGVERFQREAEALAALAHPGIVAVHSIEESEEHRFLTMELVEGAPLNELIVPGGLALQEVLDWGVAIADALAAAHEAGIVHRDIKPANIMVNRSGAVKVLDFGLAKLQHPTDAEFSSQRTQVLTEQGTLLGTVPYMAPEQVGGGVVDGRTDVFSLGVLLFEMATGRRPFQGAETGAVIAAIQRDVPVPADALRTDLPHHLARVIARCLEKDPERRYQSMKDVRNELEGLRLESQTGVIPGGLPTTSDTSTADTSSDVHPDRREGRSALGRLAAGAAVLLLLALGAWFWIDRNRLPTGPGPAAGASPDPEPTPSLAVLAFDDLSPDRDQEYLSHGLAEELLHLLANDDNLRVAARTSSFAVQGQNLDIAGIAQRLNVASVLEGSVRRIGDRIRVNAQLIDASTGFRRWSRTFEREVDDLLAVQDEIATAVAQELRGSLLGAPADASNWRADNVEAYSLYLQGKHLVERRQDEAEHRRGMDLLQRANDLEPDVPQILTTLAYGLINLVSDGHAAPEEIRADALATVERAIDLNPDDGLAWAILGELHMEVDGNWSAAEEALERAGQLAPDDPDVLRKRAELAAALGRIDDSIALAERAVVHDPLSLKARGVLFNSLAAYPRGAEMLRLERETTELGLQDQGEVIATESWLAMMRGDGAAALEILGDLDRGMIMKVGAHHLLGNEQASDEILAEMRTLGAPPLMLAELHAFRGEPDRAFDELDRINLQQASYLLSSPLFRSLAGDPRWEALLRRWNLPLQRSSP